MSPQQPIPQPPKTLVIGNLTQLDGDAPVQSLMQLAKKFGPIYQLEILRRTRLVVMSSQELVNELCDERRFDKAISLPLEYIRAFAGDGLFTAHTHEPNWGKAHRILMPAFGPLGLRKMFEPMLDIAEQLLLRWTRFGEHAVIDVADQMTRLTLDTIALCAFDYRFNSFYQNEMHPFVDAMVSGLQEAGARTRRLDFVSRAMIGTDRRYAADIRLMHEVADQLIAERRRDRNAAQKDDLLARMLNARDPVTGETLSDENIRYQMVTFLIAGHETTSGLLSFALYLLLKHPRVLERMRLAVDEVLGSRRPQLEDMPKLRYVEQVLMETLRLWPTAPAFALHARENTLLGGRYAVTPEDILFVLTPMLHRDPTVWGTDVEAFRPERFDREAELALPPNSWKPFGNGQRACIGRPFAMQEAVLVLAMVVQHFDLIEEDPSYQLRVKETLTLKPDGFRIRAKRRSDAPFRPRSIIPSAPQRPLHSASGAKPEPIEATPSLLVLYGSNTGSAEAFAQRIGSEAPAHGFSAEVATMDEYATRVPRRGAIVVVTASYEGQPPDNARSFVAALDELAPGALKGVRYAVFGCGNRQWARTYQAIPKRVDEALSRAGAAALLPRGEGDASGDFFGAFDAWYETFWKAIGTALGKAVTPVQEAPTVEVEFVAHGRTAILRQEDLSVGRLVENRELVDMRVQFARSKRHFEFDLPEGMTYRAGDYLAVLPRNPQANVERALHRFGLAVDTLIVLHRRAATLTTLPTEYPISVSELLANYVELGQPATRAQLRALAELTRCPPDKKALEVLAEESTYVHEVLDKRVSVLDLLERFPACELSFEHFLAMLPTLKARQYSIASSPLWNERRCALCIAVVEGPALSGQGRYFGVASSYLAAAAPGSRVTVAVRPSHEHFHLPADPLTPLVMICAGTGIAPFRGFLQERALQAQAGRQVGKTLLFFGCDHAGVDFLYRDELEAWQQLGVVDIRPAFSAGQEDGVRFVQDRVWEDRADVAAQIRAGAVVFLCGDGYRMAPAVRRTLAKIYAEVNGTSEDEGLRMVEETERERGRFVEDVFA